MKRQRRNRRIATTPVCCNNYRWIVLVTVFVVVDLTALVAWAVTRITDPAAMPIREVFIEAEFRHIKPGDLRTLIAQEVYGGFFTVGVKEIQDDLSHNPWIKGVSVGRVWPDGLKVTVHEQRPAARWGDKGLLSNDGVLFHPPQHTYPLGLPKLIGPNATEVQVLTKFRDLQRRMIEIGLEVVSLKLSPRRSWSFELRGGPLVIVGKSEFDRRVGRFIEHYPKAISGASVAVARVDLRYTNGFAVRTGKGADVKESLGEKV